MKGEEQFFVAGETEKVPFRESPPEVLLNKQFSKYSDAWSFGILLWEMLSRAQAYSGKNCMQVIAAVTGGERLQRPTKINHPPLLFTLIEQCWEEDPTKRPTFATLLQQVSELESQLPSFDPTSIIIVPGYYNMQSKSTSTEQSNYGSPGHSDVATSAAPSPNPSPTPSIVTDASNYGSPSHAESSRSVETDSNYGAPSHHESLKSTQAFLQESSYGAPYHADSVRSTQMLLTTSSQGRPSHSGASASSAQISLRRDEDSSYGVPSRSDVDLSTHPRDDSSYGVPGHSGPPSQVPSQGSSSFGIPIHNYSVSVSSSRQLLGSANTNSSVSLSADSNYGLPSHSDSANSTQVNDPNISDADSNYGVASRY